MAVNIQAWFKEFMQAYLKCALWSSIITCEHGDDCEDCGNGDPMDSQYYVDDFATDTLTDQESQCRDFIAANWRDLRTLDGSQCGHDFWLTRNGHGTGFWDRGYGELGDRLADASRVYGDVDLYPHDGEVFA
jgi:hypothetical protein